MANEHRNSAALQAFHYITPITVLITVSIGKVISACLLHKPSKRAGNEVRRYSAILVLLLTTSIVVAQAITYAAQSLTHQGFWATQDCVVYILASAFAYGSLTLTVVENKTPIWYPLIAAGTTGAVLEVAVAALDAHSRLRSNGYEFSRLALQIAKCLFLAGWCISSLLYAIIGRNQELSSENEAEPLLHEDSNGDATKPNYGGLPESDDQSDDEGDIDSDEDEPDQIKDIKKKQRKRLQESGSWINYMKDFKIFIPMLWPSRNRFVQACMGLIGLVLTCQRFLNVLVPRQLGIITDALTTGGGDGVFPWKLVTVWAVLSYLNSSAGIYVLQNLAQIPVQQFTYKAIGYTAFRHIMGLSMDFHNEKNSGELIRAIDQGQNMQELLEFSCFHVIPTFVDLIVAFVYVYTLFDVYMSFILMVVGAAYIWVGAKTTVWSVKRRRRFNTAWRNESKVQTEAITNWQTVSHFNRGEYETERYGEAIDKFNAAEMRYYLAHYLGSGAQNFIMVMGRLAAMFLAIYRVSQGDVPVGHFVTLTAYWGRIESPLASVSWSIRRVTQMLTDSERLLQLLLTKATVKNAEDAIDITIKEGHVEFEHVEFSYDPRKPTLKDLSFKAKPGQTVALVGETGGGKSTILKLLYRYYDVTSGAIRIDGQDLRGVTLDSLRDSFGMVPQDPSLFNISIMENIRYAKLSASDDEVMEACKAAAIHEKICSFPEKYKSTVGERGVKLSGGELQRIAIARAILRQPKIVLLDEATSMIDAETEASIQQAFKRLTADRTTFIIAHRLSTIQHADLILVINDGQILERGTHDELFRLNRKYVALWSKQLSKDVKDIGHTLHVDDDDPALIDVEDVRGVSSIHARPEHDSDADT